MEQFLQGNVTLRHLLNEETLFMSWRRSAIKEVNDWALSNWIFIHCKDIQRNNEGIYTLKPAALRTFLAHNGKGERSKARLFLKKRPNCQGFPAL